MYTLISYNKLNCLKSSPINYALIWALFKRINILCREWFFDFHTLWNYTWWLWRFTAFHISFVHRLGRCIRALSSLNGYTISSILFAWGIWQINIFGFVWINMSRCACRIYSIVFGQRRRWQVVHAIFEVFICVCNRTVLAKNARKLSNVITNEIMMYLNNSWLEILPQIFHKLP